MNDDGLSRQLRSAQEYLNALDADDADALARLWEQAETDPELEHLFCEIDRRVIEEEGLRPQWQQYKATVLAALQRHLPSAFPQEPLSSTLTIGDVAMRIASNDRLMSKLSPADRQANARLQEDRTPLPADLGMKELLRLIGEINVAPSARYWREFQQVAILASMSRGQAVAKAAAREAGKQRRPDRNPAPGQSQDSKQEGSQS